MKGILKAAVPAALAILLALAAALAHGAAERGKAKVAYANAGTSVVRLHVIANSDSAFDQNAKLAVRDAVLEAEREAMREIKTASDAQALIMADAERLVGAAQSALDSLGAKDSVRLSFGDYAFPTRTYQDKTYPAGVYRALRVTIGAGAGHNWWCVMFPPLCIVDIGAGAAALDPNKLDSLLLELIKRIDGGRFYAWIEENWR